MPIHSYRNQTLLQVKFLLIFMCVGLFAATASYAEDSTSDYSKGPLYGKNLYIPFLLHYNFPSLPAKSGEQFDLQYHLSFYYVNDVNYANNDMSQYAETKRRYIKDNITRDYESWVAEFGLAYNIFKQLQVGMDMRVFSYYGGYMDSMIEAFHNFFGFPNGKREFFSQNQVYINIPNDNGITMFLDKPATSFGDIDLWCKWTFMETKSISLAILGAFKAPTGRLSALSGSDYPDAATGLLLDFRAARYITFFTQAGAVFPFNNKSYTMFNGMAGLEIHPWKFLSFNMQMNIKTSPISNDNWNSRHGTYFKDYSLPQTNLLVGVVMRYKDFRWQFYFEEDTFTYQGADITFNISFSHTMNLKFY